MKPSFFKVYSGPGYPIDPQKEEARAMADMAQWTCKMIAPNPNPQRFNIKWNHMLSNHRGLIILELPRDAAFNFLLGIAASDPSVHYQLVNAKTVNQHANKS